MTVNKGTHHFRQLLCRILIITGAENGNTSLHLDRICRALVGWR